MPFKLDELYVIECMCDDFRKECGGYYAHKKEVYTTKEEAEKEFASLNPDRRYEAVMTIKDRFDQIHADGK